MIRFHNILVDIHNPSNLKGLGVTVLMEIETEFFDKKFDFIIPDHITENKDKKCYKPGFLNEVYSILRPNTLKKNIFEYVTTQFDIFVDERQYQNLIKEYSEKKYTTFIKN